MFSHTEPTIIASISMQIKLRKSAAYHIRTALDASSHKFTYRCYRTHQLIWNLYKKSSMPLILVANSEKFTNSIGAAQFVELNDALRKFNSKFGCLQEKCRKLFEFCNRTRKRSKSGTIKPQKCTHNRTHMHAFQLPSEVWPRSKSHHLSHRVVFVMIRRFIYFRS